MNKRYIILEDSIAYDWDDYGVYGVVLYDTCMNCIITEKYGHGIDMRFRNVSVELDTAISSGMVTAEQIITCMINELPVATPEIMENISLRSSEELPTAIPVNVVRGRKFNGSGYLVYSIKEKVNYGLGAYRNEYNHKPVIFDPETCTTHIVNSYAYLEFDKDFMSDHRKRILDAIDMSIYTVETIAHIWAYRMSYSSCDTKNYNDRIIQLGVKGALKIVKPEIVTSGMNLLSAQKKYNHELYLLKLKKEKMPGIINWVKTNTDKTTESEIMELAEHIFYKNYN